MMPDLREDEQRQRALELAVATSKTSTNFSESPKLVVDRARAYYAFLNGDREQTEGDANG